jgi:hypothetical protein
MHIFGDRKFVEVPGAKTHELPPLLVKTAHQVKRLDRVMGMAEEIVEQEELIPALPLDDLTPPAEVERRKMDLALNLVENYLAFVTHWQWGDSVIEWIRQCETTFEQRPELRHLLSRNVWPHASRASFVTLIEDKAVPHEGVALEKAVGMRLTFRQPPPIGCFSNQFLLYLNTTVASSAYRTWSSLGPEEPTALPPERFHFEVHNLSLQ